MNETKYQQKYKADYTGAFAEAFFIANLLFIGVFYSFLWILYLVKYKDASQVSKNHIKQTLVASSITTLIVVILNIAILMTAGYASLPALIAAEVYLMFIVPLFLVLGILGFTRAVNEKDFKFPLIGKLFGIKTQK